MANVADMGRQAERGRSAGLCLEQRRPGEVTIAMRSGPDRGKRHQMREVEAVHQRLSYIGVDLAGQARQPCFDRVDGFADAGKTKPVHDPLDGADLRVDCGAIAIRSEEHTSELHSLMRISYAAFRLH